MKKKYLLVLIVAIIVALPFAFNTFTKNSNYSSATKVKNVKSRPSKMGISPMMAPIEDKAIRDFNDDAFEFEEAAAEPMGVRMPPVSGGGEGKISQNTDRTIVKTATLHMVTNNTRQTVDQIVETTKKVEGLVTQSHVFENEYQEGIVNAELTVRVPVSRLEEALEAYKQFAVKVTNENISARDETEQKIDLEAQLHNLQATEQQLLGIMEQAKNVEETLDVQRELTNIRDRIERTTAQLENLEGRAALSTIHISLTTKESELPVVSPQENTLWEEIKLSVREAISFYRDLIIIGIRLSIIGLPAITIVVAAYFLLKKKKK